MCWLWFLCLMQALVLLIPHSIGALPTGGLCPTPTTTTSFPSREDTMEIWASRAGNVIVDTRNRKRKDFPPLESRRDHQRYEWNKLQRQWVIKVMPDEDLTVESLHGEWDFEPSECLTFRRGKPDQWGTVTIPSGCCGVLEFLVFMTPGLNLLLYFWRGLWPCAVCGLARSKHPLKDRDEATNAFFTAFANRDIELAIRLVRGGVDCHPGGKNWCLLAFIVGNYCKDAYESIEELDKGTCYEHLHEETERFEGCVVTEVPFL
jgi:hypothetical protein